MQNFIISLAAGLLAAIGVGLWLSPLAAIIPLLFVFGIVYFVLAKRTGRSIEGAMREVQSTMQRGPQHFAAAISRLEDIKSAYAPKQFFVGSSIDGQIGSILFMQEKFEKSRPYLEKSFVRHWNTKVMLAVLDFKKKDFVKMDAVLEKAAKYSPKQGLLWSTWAYMHQKAGHADRAIEVLNKGKVALNDADTILNDNLIALQNGKKMKMKSYGDAWYQFHLEKHPMMMKARRGSTRFARR